MPKDLYKNEIIFEMVFNNLNRFMSLTKEQINEIMGFCEIRKFEKKQVLVREGEIENYLNIVIKGLVRKYVRVKKNEVILQLASEGHLINSEISYLKQAPSLVSIETMEPTILLSISYENMLLALERLPQGERFGRLMIVNMFIKKTERKFTRLTKTVRERFFDYVANHPHMLQRVPQKYLASYLNIKQETFSRLKHLLKNRV
jgi:CRP-like cAMP-binding protein